MQESTCGRVQLPLAIVVKPKTLPLPFDRIVMTFPLLSQVGLPFQVADTFCGGVTATTTLQLLAPLTVT